MFESRGKVNAHHARLARFVVDVYLIDVTFLIS